MADTQDDTILDDEEGDEVPPAGILTDADLEDTSRYVLVPKVPVIDSHDHDVKGSVTPELLQLLARNSNARAERGDYPPILLGHTHDAEGSEHTQPPLAGACRNFVVDTFRGEPCLFADMYLRKSSYNEALTYPHRSIERLRSDTDPDLNLVDAVSLLRRAPERSLGLLSYAAALPDGVERVRYARAFDLARYCRDNPGSPECSCGCKTERYEDDDAPDDADADAERYCSCSEPAPRADGAELVRECAAAPDGAAVRKGLARLRRYARKAAKGQGSLFDESKHPRDHGQFASKEGSDGTLAMPTPRDDGKPFALEGAPAKGAAPNARAQGSLLSESKLDRSVEKPRKPIAGQAELPETPEPEVAAAPPADSPLAKAQAELAELHRQASPRYGETEGHELLAIKDRLARKLAALGPDHPDHPATKARLDDATAEAARRRRVGDLTRKADAIAEGERTGKLTLTQDEFARILAKQQDAYHLAGIRPDDLGRYPHTPEVFRTSDLSGKLVRHFVELPDGRIAHPDELHEALRRGRLIVEHLGVKPTTQPRARYSRSDLRRGLAKLVRYKAHPCGAGPEGFEGGNTCGTLRRRDAAPARSPARTATLLRSPTSPPRAPAPAPAPAPSQSPLPASAFRLSAGSAGRTAGLLDKVKPEPKPEPPAPLDPAALGHRATVAAPAGEATTADAAPGAGDFASVRADTATAPIPAQTHVSTAGDPAKEKAVADAVEQAEEGTADVAQLDPTTIHADPSRFQYKVKDEQHGGSVDAASGASGSTRDAKRWNPHLGGVLQVWKDPKDGKTYVVNGHNRLDLARRLKANKVLVQYLDVETPRQARMIGALTNIAEGHGTAIDAAKFFRDSKEEGVTAQDLEEQGLSLRGKVASQGAALANLPGHMFAQVVNEQLPVERAAIIGGSGLSHAQQEAVYGLTRAQAKKGKHVTNEHLKAIIDRTRTAGTAAAKSSGSLFGDDPEEQSLVLHETGLEAKIKERLGREKKLFGMVAKNRAAQELSRAGNTIDTVESGKVSKEAAGLLTIFDKLKNRRGPVSAAIRDAARQIHGGANARKVEADVYKQIVAAIPEFLAGSNAFAAPGAEPEPVRYARSAISPAVAAVLAFRAAGHFRYRSERGGVVRYTRHDPATTPDLMDLSRGLQRLIRYGRKPAKGQAAFGWDEDAHPRGQAENAGEFAPKGGGTKPSPKGEAVPATEPESPADPAEDYRKNGVKARAFKAWFGDWEKDPANASKVVDAETGEPTENRPVGGEGSKFKGPDGKPLVVHHGTANADFEAFDKKKVGKDNLYGEGFYFTEDHSLAEEYTTGGNTKTWRSLTIPGDRRADFVRAMEQQASEQGIELEDPDSTWTWAKARSMFLQHGKPDYLSGGVLNSGRFRLATRLAHRFGTGGGVKNVYLNIRKPFDADKDWDAGAAIVRENGGDLQRYRAMREAPSTAYIKTGAPFLAIAEAMGYRDAKGSRNKVNKLIRKVGYDGLTHEGGHLLGNDDRIHRVWIAFEPNQVKAVDNAGTFDPKDDRMRYARSAFRKGLAKLRRPAR